MSEQLIKKWTERLINCGNCNKAYERGTPACKKHLAEMTKERESMRSASKAIQYLQQFFGRAGQR